MKTLINNIIEYREWAFGISSKYQSIRIDEFLGLNIDYTCWSYNANNESIDQEGNVIPKLTYDTVILEEWVNNLSFPLIVVYWIEDGFDRLGDIQIISVDFVQLSEFTL